MRISVFLRASVCACACVCARICKRVFVRVCVYLFVSLIVFFHPSVSFLPVFTVVDFRFVYYDVLFVDAVPFSLYSYALLDSNAFVAEFRCSSLFLFGFDLNILICKR